MNGSPPRQSAAAGSVRELLQVAIPLIFSAGSMMLMHFIDRMFLTWYSSSALAASLPASMLNWSTSAVTFGTVTYVNSFVSQYDGAGKPERISKAIWQSIYLGCLMMIGTVPFVVLSWSMIPWFDHSPVVIALERKYYLLLCIASIPMILKTGFSAFYSGRGDTWVILKVNLLMVAVNSILDPMMIFGFGPIPEMGITGAGIATVITSCVGLGCYLALLRRKRECEEFHFWEQRQWDRALTGRMLRYGFPSGLQGLGDAAAFTLFLFLVGRISEQALAATNLAFNLNTLVFIPMLGVGTAITILVGRHIGEGRPDYAAMTTWKAMLLTGGFVLSFCGFYILTPSHLLEPFRRYADPQEFARVEPLVLQVLKFVAIYSLFDAMFVVFGSAIRSAGDTRVSLLVNLVSAWMLMVVPVAVMEYKGILTLERCWYACTAHLVGGGITFLLRFQYGPWRSMRVIEHDLIKLHTVESQDSFNSHTGITQSTLSEDKIDTAPRSTA